jgi:hypothetical protein
MKRILIAAAFGVTALGLAAPASAQFGRSDSRVYGDPRASSIEARRVAYDNGYREGLKEGQKESRQRDGFGYRDERTYQRADKGYHREYGDRERYRQSFRGGYSDGYAEAYRRLGYRDGPGNRGRGVGQGRYGQGGYGQGGYGQGGYGYSNSVAFQYGVQDGYEKGLEDIRKRRSHDILRHSWYRGGDRHYNSRYGSRQQYADLYRQGFRDGYERGFREGRYR